jgi:hypothetical protein
MIQTDADHATTGAAAAAASRLQEAFKPIKLLLACYLGLALLGLATTFVLRDHAELVNTAVWVRGSIVLATSALMYRFGVMAARGSRVAFRRLAVASIIVPLAIVVLIALPDPFPLWMKVQQGMCAVVVATVAVLVNRLSHVSG